MLDLTPIPDFCNTLLQARKLVYFKMLLAKSPDEISFDGDNESVLAMKAVELANTLTVNNIDFICSIVEKMPNNFAIMALVLMSDVMKKSKSDDQSNSCIRQLNLNKSHGVLVKRLANEIHHFSYFAYRSDFQRIVDERNQKAFWAECDRLRAEREALEIIEKVEKSL